MHIRKRLVTKPTIHNKRPKMKQESTGNRIKGQTHTTEGTVYGPSSLLESERMVFKSDGCVDIRSRLWKLEDTLHNFP